MSNYALVKNGIVTNIVVWDGTGNLFPEYEVVNINSVNASIGWECSDGLFVVPP